MAVPSADFGYRSNPGLEDRLTGSSYDGLLLFGRVLMALIFVQSGFGKLLDIDGFTASLAGKGVPLAGIFGVIGPGVEILWRSCCAARITNSLCGSFDCCIHYCGDSHISSILGILGCCTPSSGSKFHEECLHHWRVPAPGRGGWGPV